MTANALIRDGLLDATIGAGIPYERNLSRYYVQTFEGLEGTALKDVRVPKGWNVDEYLSRHLGGPPLLFNQHYMPADLNQYLGAVEQAAVMRSGLPAGAPIHGINVRFVP
jgi:hypothetical protein